MKGCAVVRGWPLATPQELLGIIPGLQQMGLKLFHRKFKAFKVKRLGMKPIEESGEFYRGRKTWMGFSHGFYMVENGGHSEGSLVAQREEVEGSEVWLFGVFDQNMGSEMKNYIQRHLFEEGFNQDQIWKRGKEVMKKAFICTKRKMHDEDIIVGEAGGFATVIVVKSDKFIAANFGKYKAVVVCRDGMATQIGGTYEIIQRGFWPISELLHLRCSVGDGDERTGRNSRLVVTAQKVEPNTNLVILASDGVWEVMRIQEAADLISHIEDAETAAECLAEEAINRMSKSTISCIVIRFH
ncbi:hypothetical protein J5N97_023423 [Dioscorea zingiberensis]|uniref:protein-serine/threonine phosphatase n=1 Tax=Dioscorea zingiberensis TaxID=325984 RepID=A0A9D5C4F2_9LILI|nr:hypothetical protein J5N97_023423 [Dioscorea zingiberensis]